jgi:SAM-dependent methyltransferase
MYEKKEVSILDLACGTGRNIAEIAQRISNCFVIGLDYSSEMIKCAKDIIFGIGNFNLDMGRFGFGKQVMKKYSLSNAFIAQADSANPPISFYKEEGFDFVINRMLIDRITDLERINATLKTSYLALKKGGILVFACPYNWISNETWRHFGSSRLYPLIALQNMGFDVLEAFDGLVYRELYDPHGTFLELPVQVAKLIKT